jgi:hypothetical protein
MCKMFVEEKVYISNLEGGHGKKGFCILQERGGVKIPETVVQIYTN